MSESRLRQVASNPFIAAVLHVLDGVIVAVKEASQKPPEEDGGKD